MTDEKTTRVRRVLHAINVPRILCEGLFGSEHSHHHRMAFGAITMIIGVAIAKTLGHVQYEFVAFVGDGVGYMIHGIGCIPFADYIHYLTRRD